MSRRPLLIAAALAALAFAAPAAASPVLVYDDGHVMKADDPALPAATAANPLVDAPRECGGVTPLHVGDAAADARATTGADARAATGADSPPAHTAAVSVGKALRRAYAKGAIDRATYSAYAGVYSKAKSAWHRLHGNRQRELGAVITTVNQLAAGGLLTASRMNPVFLELQRNTQWWTRTGATPAPVPSEGDTHTPHKTTACTTAGRIAAVPRVQFQGDPLTLQYYPGSGLRLQPLANFGKANTLYNACKGIDTEPGTPCEPDKLRALLDRLIDTASRRGGFLAWEYYFPFGAGRPPWVSGIATGSALSALARGASLFKEFEQQQPAQPAQPGGGTQPTGPAPPPGDQTETQPANKPHDSAYYLDIARQALPIYAHAAPLGIRASGPRGNHYLIYSFDKGVRVGNAFLESLIGLWDYWQISGDGQARSLYIKGDREAKHELPLLDTGAWSLYSLGGAESDLNYHRVIRNFAENLCERTKESIYCSKAARFDEYLHQPARVAIVGPKTAHVKKPVRIAIRVDKISCLSIQILRGPTVVYQPTWYFPRGVHSFVWTPPKAGSYHVHVLARDLMSRQSRADSDLRVLSRH
jgi:D-glucuronyl C5-epimerase C-terminus